MKLPRVGRPSASSAPQSEPGPRFLRLRDLQRRVPLSRATFWRLERRGEFPRRRKITSGTVAWVESEVTQWLARRAQIQKDAPSEEESTDKKKLPRKSDQRTKEAAEKK